MSWLQQELYAIAKSDDLHIAPFREDRKTHGTPTWIWSVRVDSDLYVLACNRRKFRWYQPAVNQQAGRIIAAGLTKEVAFETVEGGINDRIDDDVYRAKYDGGPYLDSMVSGRARAATVRVPPRENNA